MDDFPHDGDVRSTSDWLDRMGFVDKLMGWNADAIIGLKDEYVFDELPDKSSARRLCGLLQTARDKRDRGKHAFPLSVWY